jgi:hypothetical protein
MKKILTVLMLIILTATAVAVMAKDMPAPIKGKVASVNAQEKSFTMMLKDVEFTVMTSEKTRFLKDMERADFGIVAADVELAVVGKVNKEEKTINAIAVFVGEIKKPEGEDKPNFTAFGTVGNIGQNSFMLSNEKGEVAVNTSEKTKFVSKEGAKTFADLSDGLDVTIAGMLDKETKTVEAVFVYWGRKDRKDDDRGGDKPRPIMGKASNVNVDEGSFTFTTEKGELTVNVVEKTKILPKGKTLADIADGEKVAVVGKVDKESMTIKAAIITIGKPEKEDGPKQIVGKVSSIDTTAMTFTVTSDKGKTVTVSWSDKTKFFLGKEPKSSIDLTDGAMIAVVGKLDGDVLRAILISLDGKLPKKP